MNIEWTNPEKNQIAGEEEGHTFLKILLDFFSFLLYPRKFQTKQSLTPEYSTKLC